jgi:ATP-binding cassette subfamily C protein LapB
MMRTDNKLGEDRGLRPTIAPWLMQPLKKHAGVYIQVAVAAAFINIFSLASSIFSMVIYDRVVPNGAMGSLLALSLGIILILMFDFVLKSLRGYLIDYAGQGVDREIGSALFSRLLTLRMESRKGSSGVMAGLIREFEAIRDFFASATLAAIVDVPFIILFLVIIWLIGGWLVIVPMAALPIILGAGFVLQPLLTRLSSEGMQEGFSKQGVLVETISGLETIKSTSAGPLLQARWSQAVDRHAAISMRQRLVGAIAVNIASTAQQFTYVTTIIFGVFLVSRQDLTTGGLIACSMLAGRCVAPLGQIAVLLTRISHTRSAYRHLNELMETAGETREGASYIRRRSLAGGIEFQNVTFRYPGSSVRALDGVSFRIEPGEKVAILGRIGSGKSTIARLILGLYEPSEGAVLIDDTDVRQIHPEDLRRNMGAVLQDVLLLSGSMRENITLGDPGIGDDEILRASRIAGVHDFVGKIPNGYDLVLADRGEGISGGQRQSIALARALIGQRRIILLDEPTSSMDIQSENALIARLEVEMRDRTMVLVTHRASMLDLVDRVILLDRGKVMAFGPRDNILKSVAVGAR